MKRSHITIITACWKRPELFSLFCANMHQLRPRPRVVCAGSPGDGCEWIAKAYGHTYFQVPNEVSSKWNAATQAARKLPGTHFLFMGSDDFMDQRCWAYYNRFKGQHLALLDYYFYQQSTGTMLYWSGYEDARKGHPIGAAKLVRRDALEAIDWTPFRAGRTWSTDFDMHNRLKKAGVKCTIVTMATTGGISMDVKTPENLTPWKVVEQITHMRYRYLDELSPDLWNLLKPAEQ